MLVRKNKPPESALVTIDRSLSSSSGVSNLSKSKSLILFKIEDAKKKRAEKEQSLDSGPDSIIVVTQ